MKLLKSYRDIIQIRKNLDITVMHSQYIRKINIQSYMLKQMNRDMNGYVLFKLLLGKKEMYHCINKEYL